MKLPLTHRTLALVAAASVGLGVPAVTGATPAAQADSARQTAVSGEAQKTTHPRKTRFGANYTTAAHVNESIYGGRAKAARVFFQQLDHASFKDNRAVREARADGVKTFVISWKETDRHAIKKFLKGIPDKLRVYTSFNHEPEDDHGRPGSTAYKAWSREYKRQWKRQSPLMRAQGMIPTNILMAWTLSPRSGRNVAAWTPPKGTVDVFAFDAYYGKGKDPRTIVRSMVAAAKKAGVRHSGVAETGAPTSDPDRVRNTRRMKAAMIDAGIFDFGLYWNSAESSGYDSRMDKATARAWLR